MIKSGTYKGYDYRLFIGIDDANVNLRIGNHSFHYKYCAESFGGMVKNPRSFYDRIFAILNPFPMRWVKFTKEGFIRTMDDCTVKFQNRINSLPKQINI